MLPAFVHHLDAVAIEDVVTVGAAVSSSAWLGVFISAPTANIASEPYVDFQGKPVVVIDATMRPGMSGSPVVVQEPHYGSYRHRLLGIYTGRFPRLEKGDDPALGIVYKPKVIQEIFATIDA
jgi:hypothetical protein